MNIIEGDFTAKDFKFAIILGRFNDFIGNNLLEGALDCLKRHNVPEDKIDIIKVPGAFEIPLIADKLAAKKEYSAIICLGAVIRGATPHFDYVSANTASGIAQASIKHGVPVLFGVLTTDTIEQAIERTGTKAGNKGWDCAMAAIEMADLVQKL